MAQPPGPPQPPPGNYPQQPGYPPGYPPYGGQPYYIPQSNGIAVAAGVVGIISLLGGFVPFVDFLSIPGAIVAIILGIIGLQRANRMGGTSRGMAITGIVTGSVALVLVTVFIVFVFTYFANHLNDFRNGLPSFTPFPT
ncbi:MAG: DUF4190 domain-containing protein [Candidatus Dormibacteraeota bacterium]|nr:DUF4190 domain-containing protein [Candidatus Dormibacteraeota bacterium]